MTDELKSKNERIRMLNDNIDAMRNLPEACGYLFNNDVALPNVACICLNKTHELEDVFYSKGMNFYSDNTVSTLSLCYLDLISNNAFYVMGKIQKVIMQREPLYVYPILRPIGRMFVLSKVNRYVELCNYIKNFKVERNYQDALLELVFDGRLIVERPNLYQDLINESADILTKMGMKESALELKANFLEEAIKNDKLAEKISQDEKVKKHLPNFEFDIKQ